MMFSTKFPIIFIYENSYGDDDWNITKNFSDVKGTREKICIGFDCFNKNVKKYHLFIIDDIVEDLNKEYHVI